MHEFELIEKIRKIVGKSSGDVPMGIGDDAAVLKMGSKNWSVTTDCQVEGSHFSWDWIRPEELGHRLLAVNLSDIASMGAIPRFALVSIALPSSQTDKLLKFYKGLMQLARKSDIQIVGGNLSESKKGAFFDLTLIGEQEAKPLLRSGASPGELLAITGCPGESAAGFAALSKWGQEARRKFPSLVKAHLVPKAEVGFGKGLSSIAQSCIDVSDGLSSECFHLAKKSRVGIVLNKEKIFLSAALKNCAEALRKEPLDWALNGGEGYQLLFTFKPKDLSKVLDKAKNTRTRVTVIGRVEKSKTGVWIQEDSKRMAINPRGWKHF